MMWRVQYNMPRYDGMFIRWNNTTIECFEQKGNCKTCSNFAACTSIVMKAERNEYNILSAKYAMLQTYVRKGKPKRKE